MEAFIAEQIECDGFGNYEKTHFTDIIFQNLEELLKVRKSEVGGEET
jgi:hypothetical protein